MSVALLGYGLYRTQSVASAHAIVSKCCPERTRYQILFWPSERIMRDYSKKISGWRKVTIESFCIAFVFLASLSIYLAVASTREDPLEHPLFIQTNLLYPAIFFAAGHGMGTADIREIPGLADFIYKKEMQFDTANIPEDIEQFPQDDIDAIFGK